MLFAREAGATAQVAGGGPLAKLRDGDRIRLCAQRGELAALVDAAEWAAREAAEPPPPASGTGRELFSFFREGASSAEECASAMLMAAEL